MSKGKIKRHALAPLVGKREDEMRREINRWADMLPVGMIGCIVRYNNTVSALGGTSWDNLPFSVADYESDQFFPSLSSGEQDTFKIPPELGGLYTLSTELLVTTTSPLFVWQLRHTDAYTGTTTTLIDDYEFVTTDLNFNRTLQIPKVLNQGDTIALRYGSFTGEAYDFTLVHRTAFFRNVPTEPKVL